MQLERSSRRELIFVRGGLMMFMAISSIGCFGGQGNEPRLAKVTGVVVINDKPVPKVKVLFEPLSEAGPSWGLTKDDGTFEVYYSLDQPGAVLGKHRVQFHSERLLEGIAPPGSVIVIPKKYSIGSPGIEVDVVENSHEFRFDLSEKK